MDLDPVALEVWELQEVLARDEAGGTCNQNQMLRRLKRSRMLHILIGALGCKQSKLVVANLSKKGGIKRFLEVPSTSRAVKAPGQTWGSELEAGEAGQLQARPEPRLRDDLWELSGLLSPSASHLHPLTDFFLHQKGFRKEKIFITG